MLIAKCQMHVFTCIHNETSANSYAWKTHRAETLETWGSAVRDNPGPEAEL